MNRVAAGLSLGALLLTIAPAEPQAMQGMRAAAPADTMGARVYNLTCSSCHQQNGQGLDGKYPPLAGSEWVTGSEARVVRILLHGLTGEIEVQGEMISGLMPGWGTVLKDEEIAAVATYVRSTWGNKAAPIVTATVAKVRAATSARKLPWTMPELLKIP